jgi:hypothetical protein
MPSPRIRVVAVLIAGLACVEPAAPGALPVLFSAQVHAEPLPLEAVGADGAIEVQGGYTGAHCGEAAARATREGASVVRLEIGHFDPHAICQRILTGYRYEATVRGLPSGHYALTVHHRLGDASTLVLERSIDVR